MKLTFVAHSTCCATLKSMISRYTLLHYCCSPCLSLCVCLCDFLSVYLVCGGGLLLTCCKARHRRPFNSMSMHCSILQLYEYSYAAAHHGMIAAPACLSLSFSVCLCLSVCLSLSVCHCLRLSLHRSLSCPKGDKARGRSHWQARTVLLSCTCYLVLVQQYQEHTRAQGVHVLPAGNATRQT